MSSKIRLAWLCAAAAALALALTPRAGAADLDQPIFVDEAPEYAPVEVGSGWYLRGDLGYQANEAFDDDRDIDRGYGVVPTDIDSSEDRYTASVGLGYHYTDYLRGDLNVGYLPGNEIEADYDDGVNDEHADLSNEGLYGLVNIYGDLGTIAGFTPYVGAGIGFLSNKRKLDVDYDNGGQEREIHEDDWDTSVAYALNAGVAYRFTNNLSVDLGYQYLTAPDAEYFDVTDLSRYPVRDGLDFHQIRLGLRYDLW